MWKQWCTLNLGFIIQGGRFDVFIGLWLHSDILLWSYFELCGFSSFSYTFKYTAKLLPIIVQRKNTIKYYWVLSLQLYDWYLVNIIWYQFDYRMIPLSWLMPRRKNIAVSNHTLQFWTDFRACYWLSGRVWTHVLKAAAQQVRDAKWLNYRYITLPVSYFGLSMVAV